MGSLAGAGIEVGGEYAHRSGAAPRQDARGSGSRDGVAPDRAAVGSTPTAPICAWCEPGRDAPGMSHGICERHAAEMLADEWGQGVLAEIEPDGGVA